MRDNISTIPVNEVFEKKCGCPICALKDEVEKRTLEYIMGEAMMEPDVRTETNKKGFCSEHYSKMLKMKNRLSLALMLETHIDAINSEVFNSKGLPFLGNKLIKSKKSEKPSQSCFVCERIDWGMNTLLGSLCNIYSQKEDFRKLFAAQPLFCLPHFYMLTEIASGEMNKKTFEDFSKVITAITKRALIELKEDVSWYCKKSDYRFADADWKNSKDAVERAIAFLTAKKAING